MLCRLFSSCREPGYSLVVVYTLLIAVAFLVLEHRLLGETVSVAVACGLGTFGSQVQNVLNSLLCTGLVDLRHVEFSWISDRTHVSCIGRQILYH